jgi:hypothetical protein
VRKKRSQRENIAPDQPASSFDEAGQRGHATEEPHMSQDTAKPNNLRANRMPTDGFVLSVDRKLKGRFETAEEAMTAGSKLKQRFPVTQIAVYDATERVYTPVDRQEK